MKHIRANRTYNFDLNGSQGQVLESANGVTIENGARCSFTDSSPSPHFPPPTGSPVTLINNTAATPISGTFSNLADGSTMTAGNHSYQVSYSGGGDGNDLVLTALGY